VPWNQACARQVLLTVVPSAGRVFLAVEIKFLVRHVGQLLEGLVIVSEGDGLEIVFVDFDWTRLLFELPVVRLGIVGSEALVARVLFRRVEGLLLRDVFGLAVLAFLWVRESSCDPLLSGALV
jgi:hypothetical protein